MMEFEATVFERPPVWDESTVEGCSKTVFGLAGAAKATVAGSFDKSIKGKWTERVSVGDFSGVGAPATDCEALPLSSRIPLSDT